MRIFLAIADSVEHVVYLHVQLSISGIPKAFTIRLEKIAGDQGFQKSKGFPYPARPLLFRDQGTYGSPNP
jgi:hypothetical protein